MRKEIGLVIIFILFSMSFSSAISSDMKSIYFPGETMIVKFSGNILDILSLKQVKFIRAGNVQEVPMIYDLKKIGDSYYLWAVAPKIQNNYTLIIDEVVTTVAGTPTKNEFRQNFSVNGNLTDYGISPGFVIADKAFEIQVQLYADEDKSISVDFPKERSIILQPGTTVVSFSFENVAGTQLKIINIGKYKVPIYLSGSSSSSSNSASNFPLVFSPTILAKTLSLERKNKSISFSVVNNGKEEIKNIRLTYDSEIFSFFPNTEINLKAGENKTYFFTLLKEDGIRVQDQISVQSGEWKAFLPIRIDFNHNVSENITIDKNSSQLYRCNELGGNICSDNQKCSGATNASQEGLCCVGTCSEKEHVKNDGSATIGYFLAVLVVIGLGYLYWKYRKTKAEKNPLSKKVKEIEKNIP